jgi:hypothetical protein
MADPVLGKFGRIDIPINNAGGRVIRENYFTEMDLSNWVGMSHSKALAKELDQYGIKNNVSTKRKGIERSAICDVSLQTSKHEEGNNNEETRISGIYCWRFCFNCMRIDSGLYGDRQDCR